VIDDGAEVLARVDRGGVVEAVHAGHAVALGADGAPLVRAGDPDGPFLPRSSLKPLQAVAMLRAGLALDGPGLALACASHEGEPAHVEGVLAILGRAGLTPAHLQTPPVLPSGPDAAFGWRCFLRHVLGVFVGSRRPLEIRPNMSIDPIVSWQIV